MISANLSVKQLSRPDLAETVEAILKETGLEGRYLTLDITETVYVEALATNTAVLDRLRGLGVKVSTRRFRDGLLLVVLPQEAASGRPKDRQDRS